MIEIILVNTIQNMYYHVTRSSLGFPGGSDSKEFTCDAGDQGSISVSGRSPGEGDGNPLQYSCLEKSTGKGN